MDCDRESVLLVVVVTYDDGAVSSICHHKPDISEDEIGMVTDELGRISESISGF